jgi:hypothetical protein
MINHNDTAARCAELVLANSNTRTLRDPSRLLRRIDATIARYCDNPDMTALDIALIRSITITTLALI